MQLPTRPCHVIEDLLRNDLFLVDEVGFAPSMLPAPSRPATVPVHINSLRTPRSRRIRDITQQQSPLFGVGHGPDSLSWTFTPES